MAAPSQLVGETLGHYKILEQIGAGGMGVVYRARDNKLGREVALKVLPEDVAHDRERMGRFEREAQVLALLNHPNIAAIHGLEESDIGVGDSDRLQPLGSTGTPSIFTSARAMVHLSRPVLVLRRSGVDLLWY
jgi:serine/threonine protein kinase